MRGWKRLNDTVNNVRQLLERTNSDGELGEREQEVFETLEKLEIAFVSALADDFNTAMAIGVLFDAVREVNGYIGEQDRPIHGAVLEKALTIFEEYGGNILGILRQDGVGREHELVAPLLDFILELREELRQERNFPLADKIRIRLGEMGITVEDTPQGPRWKV